MGVVPVKLAQLKIGPVFDFALREEEGAVARLQELDEGDDAVVQAGGCVGGDRHAIAAQLDLVCLLRQRVAVAILRLADLGGVRGDDEAQRACRAGGSCEVPVKSAIELVVEDFEGRVAGWHSLTHYRPVAGKDEFGRAEADHLGLRHHDVSAGEQRRYRVRARRGKEKECERYGQRLHETRRVYQGFSVPARGRLRRGKVICIPRGGAGRREAREDSARHFGIETLRRPGFPGVCRACPAASDWIGIYEDVGAVLIALSTSSVPSFRFSISVPGGPAINAIRTSPGCFPFERKIFPPALLPYRGAP